LSVSRASAAEIERRFAASDVIVVPNATQLVPLPPSRDVGDAVRVLYLGGFANQAKGGAVLADALPSLLRECPSMEVTLAGPGEPPASLAHLLGDSAVRWRGWLDTPSKDQALARCDIFVLPSVSEGLPLALLEAMSCARAIVATRVGGVPEILEHDTNGVLVEPQQPDLLVRELAALAADGDKRLRLGRAARASAERLNAEEVSGRLDAVYRELVPRAS
jgi:glycosyltransferase involved in cell wall biosynthesis